MVEFHIVLMIISCVCTAVVGAAGSLSGTLFCLGAVIMNLLAVMSFGGVI